MFLEDGTRGTSGIRSVSKLTGSRLAAIARSMRRLKVGSHAQPALTREQRRSRAKTDRRNARFAFSERLRAQGLYKKARNISKSRFVKDQQEIDVWVGGAYERGRMVSRAPSVQNIPRPKELLRDPVPASPAAGYFSADGGDVSG